MDKLQKARKLSLNTILFTISGFGSKIISFLLVPLYTYVLSTEEYGNLDLMSTTAQLLIPILTLNIQDAVLRYAIDRNNEPGEVINIALKIFGIGSTIMLFGVFLIYNFNLLSIGSAYLWYLFAIFITNSLNNIISMYLRAIDKIKVLVICGVLNTLISCILNILFLLVFDFGVIGYMTANISGTIVSVILMLFFGGVPKELTKKGTPILFGQMVAYSMPLILNSIAWWINNASDRYILTFFCGATINGIYAVSYKIPTILSTLQGIFNNSWSISAITEFDKDDKDGFIGNVYTIYSCISFIGCSAVMLINIYIAKFLYANEFFEAWRCVPFLLLGTVFSGIGLFEGCLFTAVKKTKDVSHTTILGAIANTILNFTLIPFMGAVGAAIATCIGYFVTWLFRIIFLRKIVIMKVEWNIQLVSMIILIGQSVVATLSGVFYYQIIFFLIIIFLQRKYIAKVVKKVVTK